MKIILVTEFFPAGKNLRFSGGVEARTFFIAKNLAKENKVIVLSSRTTNSQKYEKMFNFKIYRVGPIREYSPTVGDVVNRAKFLIEAVKFARNIEADVIEGSNFISHFIAARVAKQKKIPAVAWYPDVWIGSWLKNAGIIGLLGEILERINLKFNFDTYIAISKETANKLRKYVKNQIEIIPCGVDQEEFIEPSKKFPNPTIICVSRLTKYKNIRILILAFALLSTKIKEARLIIVGTGPELGGLKALSRALKINRKIKFASNLPRNELIILIKSSHIFSLPSLVEGFGIATIEAAAAGLPYVNSNTPIQKEITKNSLGGFLVDPQDPIKFSNCFYNLITDDNLYNKKSKEAQNLSKLYDWKIISKKTGKIYREML